MANFDTYIETLLKHEGGYVDDPWEPRGPSNKGIALGTLDECAHFLLGVAPSLANLRALNDAQASAIYRVLYWNRICGDDITYQPLANILFDFQVEAGSIASCLLQRVLNTLHGGERPAKLRVDGWIGRKTLAVLARADAEQVYAAYKRRRLAYYIDLVERHPELSHRLDGWLDHLSSFPDIRPRRTAGRLHLRSKRHVAQARIGSTS